MLTLWSIQAMSHSYIWSIYIKMQQYLLQMYFMAIAIEDVKRVHVLMYYAPFW